jgi:hypothetical protein
MFPKDQSLVLWRGRLSHWYIRGVVLLISSVFLFGVFLAPDVRLTNTSYVVPSLAGSGATKTPADEFILAEHQKAVDEIKMRIQQEDDWYRYKFFLVGGLLAAFLVHLGRARAEEDSPDERLERLLRSTATTVVLALSCVIAVTVDLRVRNSAMVTAQLGLWIAKYLEPRFLGYIRDTISNEFLPWESFLRVKDGGFQIDPTYALILWPNLHFLTGVLYAIYLTLFHKACVEFRSGCRVLLGGFALVHASLAVFALAAHTAPEIFALRVWYWRGWELWLSGWQAPS